MAYVMLTIRDHDDGSLICSLESMPPIPILDDGHPDVDKLTTAQAAALYAMSQLADPTPPR